MSETEISRRTLLKGGGALVVTFAFVSRPNMAATAGMTQKSVSSDEVGGYIAIDGAGLVTLYSGKVELGTGVLTAITQIAAEELSVPVTSITIIQGDTQLTPNQGPTYASLSIQNGGMQIRRAAATARDALLARAATQLRVPKDLLGIHNGVVAPKSGGEGLLCAIGGRPKLHDEVGPDGLAQRPSGLQNCRYPGCSARHSRQDLWHLYLCPRF